MDSNFQKKKQNASTSATNVSQCSLYFSMAHVCGAGGWGVEQFAIAYLDDLLIFSAGVDEHLKHLKTVFAQLRKHGQKIKLSKYQFIKKETKYLGFIIDESGVHPHIDKVEVIRAMPEPRTVREVRGFIAEIGYYRRFIPAFSRIATPLIALTKKYAHFSWTED